MIDIDGDGETLVALLAHAEKLALLDGPRLERELAEIHKRAVDALVAGGQSDIEAYFAADAIVTRLRGMIERRRARLRPQPGGGERV